MQMTELIAAARFVVDSDGHKKAVMLDYGHWQELLTLLEDLSDLAGDRTCLRKWR